MSEAGSPFIKFRVIFGNPFYMAHAVFLGVYSAPPSLLSLKHLLLPYTLHKPTAMAREVLTTTISHASARLSSWAIPSVL